MMWDNDRYDVGWPAMALMMMAFWVLAGAAFYLAVRHLAREARPTEAQRILDQRVARGEIDLEEYTRIRDAIGAERPVVPRR